MVATEFAARRFCGAARRPPIDDCNALLVGQPEPDVSSGGAGRLPLVAQVQHARGSQSVLGNDEGVSPGDQSFLFVDTKIQAVGIAQSYGWESPKPVEFGNTCHNWEDKRAEIRFPAG